MTDSDAAAAELDALMAALTTVRGRGRGPFAPPPGAGGPFGRDERGEGGRGHGHGRRRPGGEGAGGEGAGGWGPGPWGAAGGRFGGPARLRLLEALVAASHPLSVSEVGEAIGVDQPRASRLIQQAVELGLVQREADPDDARRTRVALTAHGAKVARGFRGQRREHLAEALADFSAEERAELVRLLSKLAAAWPQA